MSSLDERIRQFKHLLGDGKLVAMASFVEVHDDGAGERCIELHLAFEDQTLNPHGTGTWIVNSTTVSADDDWQAICDSAIDAAEEFYTDLLKFHGCIPADELTRYKDLVEHIGVACQSAYDYIDTMPNLKPADEADAAWSSLDAIDQAIRNVKAGRGPLDDPESASDNVPDLLD